jgi:hypothetical protein
MEEIDNLNVLLNGESLELILGDEFLRTHVAFICMICKSVIGFNFSHKNKAEMARLIKSSFVNYRPIISIGDSFGD